MSQPTDPNAELAKSKVRVPDPLTEEQVDRAVANFDAKGWNGTADGDKEAERAALARAKGPLPDPLTEDGRIPLRTPACTLKKMTTTPHQTPVDELSGIDLDEAVARELFGMDIIGRFKAWNPDGGEWGIYDGKDDHPVKAFCVASHSRKEAGCEAFGGWRPDSLKAVPDYSTDGNAMMDVLAEIERRGFSWECEHPKGWSVSCAFYTLEDEEEKTYVAIGDTLPIAVCRAALLAARAKGIK